MLKAGIILVGIKLSLLDVASTGVMTVPAVMASIGMGMVLYYSLASTPACRRVCLRSLRWVVSAA